jgi:AcrR family transcriptional regulator
MRDSQAKRRLILDAATVSFIEHGYDRTTFATVSKNSRAAVGSVVHFFGDKAQLAAAVYDDVAAMLVADCEAALNGQGRDAETAIRALMRACLAWPERFPNHRRLLALLEANIAIKTLSRIGGLQHRLEPMLAAWAHPLIMAGLIAPMSPAQLHAVLMAPAMSVIGSAEFSDVQDSGDWLEILTQLAVRAIAPQASNPKPSHHRGTGKVRSVSTGSPQGDTDQGAFSL